MEKEKYDSERQSEELSKHLEEFDEQLMDTYSADIHKILSGVYQNLKDLGCKDLPVVEEQFQSIEGRVGLFIDRIKLLRDCYEEMQTRQTNTNSATVRAAIKRNYPKREKP
jgi:hypothetical protein